MLARYLDAQNRGWPYSKCNSYETVSHKLCNWTNCLVIRVFGVYIKIQNIKMMWKTPAWYIKGSSTIVDIAVVACFLFLNKCYINESRDEYADYMLQLQNSNDPGLQSSTSCHTNNLVQYCFHLSYNDFKWSPSHKMHFLFPLSQLHLQNPFLSLIHLVICELYKS